jgi:putative phosphoesterase
MLIGILSDTHDNIAQAKKAVAHLNREGVEQVLHAGDYVAPFMIDTLKDLQAPMTGVFGNNDGDRELLRKKAAGYQHLTIDGMLARIEADGCSVALMHGHDRVLFDTLANCSSIDIIVYGHTHRPEVRRQGSVLIVNPGEVYGHLTGKSTVAVVDTKKMDAEIVEI